MKKPRYFTWYKDLLSRPIKGYCGIMERLERDFSFKTRDKIDLLFKLGVNRWNGEERPQLELFDIRKSQGKA